MIRVDSTSNAVTLVDSDLDKIATVEKLALNGTGTQTVTLGSNADSAFSTGITITTVATATSLNFDGTAYSKTITATGTDNNDTLKGGTAADTLSGGKGNDTITASDADSIDGGDGTDTVSFGAAVSKTNLVNNDLVNVESILITNTADAAYDFSVQTEDMTITGGAKADTITGGAGAESITGGVGIDSILGGAGNDTIIGASDDFVDGGADTDTLEIAGNFNDNGDGAIANFEVLNITAAGKNVILEEQTEALVVNGFASGVNTIVGGDGNDSITGATGHNDNLSGGSGEDTFVGADNNDTIEGGGGTDVLKLVDSYTAQGVNTLDSVENISVTNNVKKTLDLSNQAVEVFQITLTGSAGHVVVLAGGADSVDGSAGADSITASSGNDTIKGGAGNDTIFGGDELDNLDGGANDDSLDGGKSADTLIGGDGADTLKGQSGEDDLRGGGGIDQLYGGLGSDKFIFDQTDGTTDVIHSYTTSDQFVFDISDLSLNGGDYSVATSGTLISVTNANSLSANAASDHVIWDNEATIGAFSDSANAFAGPVIAITKDTGKVMYDADGDFSSGAITLATFDSTKADDITGDNIGFIA